MTYLFLFIIFLCWGSFLNALSYRLIYNYSIIRPRSFCPTCKTTLPWYDLIPVISWIALQGHCRSCKASISYLYPAIELLTASSFMLLISTIKPTYWLAYGLFISALIITIRSDTQSMLISRYATLYIIPLAWILSFFKLLPITLGHSIFASIISYLFLFISAYVFYYCRKKQGLGEGDMELLATIGAFIGLKGAWFSLLVGSFLGSIAGLYKIYKGVDPRVARIPFGLWLSIGALLYIFLQKSIFYF